MKDEQDEMVRDFLVESLENLDRLDQELLILEKEPQHMGVLNSVFRTIHTIKGTCGFFGFENLESLSHVGENLLDSLRSGKKKLTPDITNVLLKMVDAIRELLQLIETTGKSGENYYEDLKFLLAHHNSSATSQEAAPVELTLEEEFAAVVAAREAEEAAEAQELNKVLEETPLKTEVKEAPKEHSTSAGKPHEVSVTPHEEAPRATEHKPEPPSKGAESGGLQDSSIRVDVTLLDELMNLVGELVLARNQLRQITSSSQDQNFQSTFQRLNIITTELQVGVMKTRMQPIHSVWSKFPRVVRDVSQQCGKKVQLLMEGKDTELDKTIIEAIKDPLVHIVRNSIDHGIEAPAERIKNKKPEEGTLLLKAFHEGGYVIIEIIDDGGGLKVDKIKDKAVERGLITLERAIAMTDQEAFKLIFQPGFSTAEQITNFSGRGVGMDVVRVNIEKIGGSLEVDSERGKGTKLRIKIPLTLAIVPALIVSCENEIFAIPQVSLIELVRLDEALFDTDLETIKGATFYRLRGSLLPLIYVSEELKLNHVRPQHREKKKGRDRVINIVVVRADMQVFGMVVDEVHDTEEIVVKSVSKGIKDLGVYAGATIMGDGRVALILDVMSLAQKSHVLNEKQNAVNSDMKLAAQGVAASISDVPLLIVELGVNEPAAVPLELVKRLEEFSHSDIESLNGRSVVQYRGGILDLVDLRTNRGFHPDDVSDQEKTCQVIVLNDSERQIGFMVCGIFDVVKHTIDSSRSASRHGSRGAAIIQDRIMDVLDLHMLAV
jgi:two-component system, chemotaxis family, sensor kinase CheA